MSREEDFKSLNILAENMGYKFDGVSRTEHGTAVILVDSDGQEIAYQGNTVEDAVHVAAHKLMSAINGREDGEQQACEDCGE